MKRDALPTWKSAKFRRPMQMGIGMLGSKVKCPECDEEFTHCPSIVFKRKFRWTVEGETAGGKLEPMFVKMNTRPQVEIEETEINFLGNKTWVPGKQYWESLNITTWDLDPKTEFWKVIYASMHADATGEVPLEKLGKFKLCLYDGCGCLIEWWEINDAYINKVNFIELDHSSCEVVDVELGIKYKSVTYKNALATGEHKYLPGYNAPSNKATCPNCKHEFPFAPHMLGMLGNPNIIY